MRNPSFNSWASIAFPAASSLVWSVFYARSSAIFSFHVKSRSFFLLLLFLIFIFSWLFLRAFRNRLVRLVFSVLLVPCPVLQFQSCSWSKRSLVLDSPWSTLVTFLIRYRLSAAVYYITVLSAPEDATTWTGHYKRINCNQSLRRVGISCKRHFTLPIRKGGNALLDKSLLFWSDSSTSEL
jgi:hypothetical protein